jgi:hypothetical protein
MSFRDDLADQAKKIVMDYVSVVTPLFSRYEPTPLNRTALRQGMLSMAASVAMRCGLKLDEFVNEAKAAFERMTRVDALRDKSKMGDWN